MKKVLLLLATAGFLAACDDMKLGTMDHSGDKMMADGADKMMDDGADKMMDDGAEKMMDDAANKM